MSCKLLALIIISNCPDIGRKVYYALLIMSTKPFLWQIFCLMKSRIPRRLLSSPCPCNWKILSSSSQFQIKSFLPLQLPLTIGIASRCLHIKASKTPIECESESISDQQKNLSFFLRILNQLMFWYLCCCFNCLCMIWQILVEND